MNYLESDIEQAVQVLRQGGVILYPTDTVWGIGCDATDVQAVQRIYAIKHREDSKAMLILADHDAFIADFIARHLSETEKVSSESALHEQRPTTYIYPYAGEVATNLRATDGTIGVRVTREPFTMEICRRLGHPIVSTSANLSGQPTPRFFQEISQDIRDAVDYICQYRRDDTTPHQPSRIIKIQDDGTVITLRP